MANDAVFHTLISVVSILLMLAVIAREKHVLTNYYEGLMAEEGADRAALEKEKKIETEEFENQQIWFFNLHAFSDVLRTLFIMVFFINGNIEFAVHTPSNFGGNDLRKIVWGIFNTIFILGLWLTAKKLRLPNLKSNAGFLIVLSVITYFFMGTGSAVSLRNQFLMSDASFFPFFLHYFDILLGMAAYYLLLHESHKESGDDSMGFSILAYLGCLIATIHLSIELDHFFVLTGYFDGVKIEDILHTSHLVGYSLLWTVSAFGILILGMRFKIKELRMYGISLFLLVILKFFAWDFWQIDKIGKIIAFIVIGAVLVAVSAMYTRLQKMLIEGEISALTGAKRTETDSETGENASREN
jgi:hypothetical protein